MRLRFAFDGRAGEILSRHYEADQAGAVLSSKFRLYYKLRPFIPIPMRQWLQRGRNQSLETPTDWYIPTAFLDEFRDAIEKSPDDHVIHPWPDDFRMSVSLTHDVETHIGFGLIDKLAKIEEGFGLRSAWNIIPHKYKVDHGLLNDLKQRGHEIGVHGYNHDGRLFESRRVFDRRTVPINEAIKAYGSTGFRAPMVHRNLDWLQAIEVDYDASTFDIDPFQAMPGGVGGVWPFMAGKLVELPYTLPQDHTLLVSLGETTPDIWIKKFEWLRLVSGMAMLVTHPDYLDTPARLDVYRRFLEYVAEQTDAWKVLPEEIANWWRARDAMTVKEGQIFGNQSERGRPVRMKSII